MAIIGQLYVREQCAGAKAPAPCLVRTIGMNAMAHKVICLPASDGTTPVLEAHARQQLQDWLPEGSVLACATEAPEGALSDIESLLLGRARGLRRQHFRAGRVAARAALASAGERVDSIGRDAHRAPEWPQGWCGSISHTRGLVLALVAPAKKVAGIGIDAEYHRPVSDRAYARICATGEADTATPAQRLLRFSAKEAVYKCLAPMGGHALGFGDVIVTLSDDGTWTGLPADDARQTLQPWPLIAGHWIATEQHVMTLAWVDR